MKSRAAKHPQEGSLPLIYHCYYLIACLFMKRICPTLPKGSSIYFGLFTFLLAILSIHTAKSQVINEGFEETVWAAGFGNSSGSIVVTNTSANSIMSYMSVQGQSSFSLAKYSTQ
jgi:hypothetical protein